MGYEEIRKKRRNAWTGGIAFVALVILIIGAVVYGIKTTSEKPTAPITIVIEPAPTKAKQEKERLELEEYSQKMQIEKDKMNKPSVYKCTKDGKTIYTENPCS